MTAKWWEVGHMTAEWVVPKAREPLICPDCGGAIPSQLHDVAHEKLRCTIDGCSSNMQRDARYCLEHSRMPARRRVLAKLIEGALTRADRDYARRGRPRA